MALYPEESQKCSSHNCVYVNKNNILEVWAGPLKSSLWLYSVKPALPVPPSASVGLLFPVAIHIPFWFLFWHLLLRMCVIGHFIGPLGDGRSQRDTHTCSDGVLGATPWEFVYFGEEEHGGGGGSAHKCRGKKTSNRIHIQLLSLITQIWVFKRWI